MDKKLKILTAVGVILFVCLIIWTVRTTPKAPEPTEKIDPPKVMEYEGNTIVEEKDGVKIWEITTEKVRVDTTTQIAEFDKVSGKFYQEDGKVLELTANNGTYNQKSRDVHVEGDVVVLDGDGGKLTSKNLDFKGAEEILIANEDVKIFKDDMQAFGDRAESRDGFKHFFLKGHARVLKGVKNTENISKNVSENVSANKNGE